MFNRDTNSENESDENTFDFAYKMDISGRKGRTGEHFNLQDGSEFEDFRDLREDRTQKSEIKSNKKWLASELNKLSDDNSVDLSCKRKNSFTNQEGLNRMKGGSNYLHNISPKFNEVQSNSYRTINHNMNPTHDHELSRLSGLSQHTPYDGRGGQYGATGTVGNCFQKIPHFSEKASPNCSPMVQSPLNRDNGAEGGNGKLTMEADYEDTVATVQYLQKEGEELDYETSKVMQEVVQLQEVLKENRHEGDLRRYGEQTSILNGLIKEEKGLERKLMEISGQLEEEFDHTIESALALNLQRPAVAKDETKVIIEEINSLKKEVINLKREEGSLNLSSFTPASAEHHHLPAEPRQQVDSPEDLIFKQYVREIQEYDRQIPNYLHNTKMLAIKDEWKLYENPEVAIFCSYRSYPELSVKIGNKTSRNLVNFTLKEGATSIADAEILLKKSYYAHSHLLKKIAQPFIKLELAYSIQDEAASKSSKSMEERLKSLTFFLPSFTLKHGEFIPITRKEYNNESKQHRGSLEETKTIEKPMDHKIIKNSIKELRIYYPNLIYDEEEQDGTCRGLFQIWDSNDGALVKVHQSGNLLSIRVKGNIPFLLKALEFLLTGI